MTPMQLTDATFETEVLRAKQPVVVDMWAPWCGPCRALAPILDELAGEYAGRVKIAKLDTDENEEVPRRYNVAAIPTVLFLKDGTVFDRLVGVHPKAEFVRRIDAMLEGASPVA